MICNKNKSISKNKRNQVNLKSELEDIVNKFDISFRNQAFA